MSGYRLVFDTAKCLTRFDPRFKQAQKLLDSEVLRSCEPYVPYRTGQTVRSGQQSTVVGSGKVQYTSPHARKIYYGKGIRFRKDTHPKATALWFEKAKATDFAKWVQDVNKTIKGD